MRKVSIIIPNYNNDKFIIKCLESVVNQDYNAKEIIVIDDGSSDKSVEMVETFMKNNAEVNLRLVCQNHLNAAMARNRGMELAHGDYVLFLDSDDLLDENTVLSRLVRIYEDNKVDLVMGDFCYMNESGVSIGKKHLDDGVKLVNTKKSFAELAWASPMPSNKLYNLKLIRDNDLNWGNVRIGQDLNFYLKYLSLSKKIAIVSWPIYKYRITHNSITRTYDFRIFDIVNVFDDVKDFYYHNGKGELYKKYIPLQELRHFNAQMLKQRFYKNYKTRLLIIQYFAINWNMVDSSICKNNKGFRKEYCKFHLQCTMRLFFASKIFKILYGMIEKKRSQRNDKEK